VPSNADALWRSRIYQTPSGGAPADDLPDWLKSQFTQTSGQFQREDGSTGENWLQPGHIIRDANGNRVVMLGDNGQIQDTNDLAMNPDYDPGQHSYYDPNLGWVASADYVNDSPWQKTHSRNKAIAATVMAAMAGAGAYGAAAGGAGAGAETGLGLDALETFTATNPGWEAAYAAGEVGTGAGAGWEGLGAGDGMTPPDGWSFDGGMAFEQSPIPSLDDLGVNPNTGGGTFEGTGWTPESAPTGNPFSARDMIRGANTLRSVLGGGGGGQGQGQGGMPIMGGFGSSPRIGDHKQDNDPFGLKASGWGGGFVKEDPKQKIAQALMERNPWSYTG